MEYDVFISHASEDKESFVEPPPEQYYVLVNRQSINIQYKERQK